MHYFGGKSFERDAIAYAVSRARRDVGDAFKVYADEHSFYVRNAVDTKPAGAYCIAHVAHEMHVGTYIVRADGPSEMIPV